jgi:pSer/pThr/pTyr-binding forkhead associated (FHA) protein
MVMRVCTNCGAALRPQSRFCPQCATPVQAPAGPGAGFAPARSPRPPVPRPAPVPPRGTVIKSEPQRPGTVLYGKRDQPPVLGWLVILKGPRLGTDFKVSSETVVIGREGRCDVALDDETASREHARIRVIDGEFVIFDLGSGNGTFVNRRQVQRENLHDGDVIKVGETLLLFKEAKPGPQWSDGQTAPGSDLPGNTDVAEADEEGSS